MPTPALGNRRLSPYGTDVEQLFGGRFRVIRRWQLDDMNAAPSHDHVTEEYFNDYGDEDLTPWGSDEAVAPEGFKFEDCVLTRQYTTYPPGLGIQLLIKEYETVTDTFADTQEPRKSVLESGLGRLDVEQIGSPTAAFTGVVGTTAKVVDGKTYYLANVQEVESTESFVRLNTVWLEDGVLRRSKSRGPVSGTTVETIVSFKTKVTPTGAVIQDDETNEEGIPTFTVSAIQGTIEGVKSTWTEPVQVETPGILSLTVKTINLNEGTSDPVFNLGTVPLPDHTPPRVKTVFATVEIEITTTPPTSGALAYNLENISCSLTSVDARYAFLGTDTFVTASGNTRFSGQKHSGSIGARRVDYPKTYISGNKEAFGRSEWVGGWENTSTNPNTLVTVPRKSIIVNQLFATGSDEPTGYTEEGIIQRRVRPLFTLLDGTEYYEVVTWATT